MSKNWNLFDEPSSPLGAKYRDSEERRWEAISRSLVFKKESINEDNDDEEEAQDSKKDGIYEDDGAYAVDLIESTMEQIELYTGKSAKMWTAFGIPSSNRAQDMRGELSVSEMQDLLEEEYLNNGDELSDEEKVSLGIIHRNLEDLDSEMERKDLYQERRSLVERIGRTLWEYTKGYLES